MSLYQCEYCGAVENTALACQGCDGYTVKFFDWSGLGDRKGKKLCSECAPPLLEDGSESGLGSWHDEFPRRILPIGEWQTDSVGNLENIKTGDTDYVKAAAAYESEKLIDELESTYLVGGWRSDSVKVARVRAIRLRLSTLLKP